MELIIIGDFGVIIYWIIFECLDTMFAEIHDN